MSWKKASTEVGLAGFTPHEVARSALCMKAFQKIPDPFEEVMKQVKVSTVVQLLK